MSKKKSKTNMKLSALNELNAIDKRIKRFKSNLEKVSQLLSQRDTIRTKLKTKK
tara:strand:- start:513 stop:674 length:162 start_codon:yes stop_codon:yes gene_type:complete